VGYLKSDSVGLLVYDNMRNIRGISVVLQVSRDNANPAWKGLIS